MKMLLAVMAMLSATSAMAAPSAQRQQITPPVHQLAFSASIATPDPGSNSAPTVMRYTFTIPAGGTSSAIPIPTNRPVKFMATQITSGTRGMGEATLLAPSPAAFVEWIGYDYPTGAFSQGFTSTAGTHIVWVDFSENVDAQVAGATHIQIHNADTSSQKVKVTLIY